MIRILTVNSTDTDTYIVPASLTGQPNFYRGVRTDVLTEITLYCTLVR